MNIIVRPFGQKNHYCRPDTTWEKENRDFYMPAGIMEIHWVPVVFARISKAGKCIGAKFAERYYDSFNFGALLYCIGAPGDPQEIAFTSHTDHSSILPSPLYNPAVTGSADNVYAVMKNGEDIFRTDTTSIKQELEEAITAASERTSLRIGDYVAVELSPVTILISATDSETALKATFCDNDLYEFKIIP